MPPTALNARTGELTPPGMLRFARSNRVVFIFDAVVCKLLVVVIKRYKVGFKLVVQAFIVNYP